MAIEQAFNPFEQTVGSGKSGWILPVVFLLIVAVAGYFAYKYSLDEPVN